MFSRVGTSEGEDTGVALLLRRNIYSIYLKSYLFNPTSALRVDQIDCQSDFSISKDDALNRFYRTLICPLRRSTLPHVPGTTVLNVGRSCRRLLSPVAYSTYEV